MEESKFSVPPGEFIKEELKAREWSQRDLAHVLGCSEQSIALTVNGKRSITSEMAKALAIAFDVSPKLFISLQKKYNLTKGVLQF
jgi:addiction module HigA family antidote